MHSVCQPQLNGTVNNVACLCAVQVNEISLARMQMESKSALLSAECSRLQASLEAAKRERSEFEACESKAKRQLAEALDAAHTRLDKLDSEARTLRTAGSELRQAQERVGELERTVMQLQARIERAEKV